MKKYKLGICFGAWDALHYGHLNLFIRAKEQCDKLIVCMSDDNYIKKHKKRNPFLSFRERFVHLSAISTNIVDIIDVQTLIFGKKEAILKYNPDVLIVGNDWNKKTYTGEGLGVPVWYLSRTSDISSTLIREEELSSKKEGLML